MRKNLMKESFTMKNYNFAWKDCLIQLSDRKINLLAYLLKKSIKNYKNDICGASFTLSELFEFIFGKNETDQSRVYHIISDIELLRELFLASNNGRSTMALFSRVTTPYLKDDYSGIIYIEFCRSFTEKLTESFYKANIIEKDDIKMLKKISKKNIALALEAINEIS